MDLVPTTPEITDLEKISGNVYTGKRNINGSIDLRQGKFVKNWAPLVDYKEKVIVTGTTPNSTAVMAGGFAEMVNLGLTTTANYFKAFDAMDLIKQTEGENNIFYQAYDDMEKAMNKGMLNNMSVDEISNVYNVVLYGGDGNETKNEIGIGRTIIEKYSNQDAKNRLTLTKLQETLINLKYKPE